MSWTPGAPPFPACSVPAPPADTAVRVPSHRRLGWFPVSRTDRNYAHSQHTGVAQLLVFLHLLSEDTQSIHSHPASTIRMSPLPLFSFVLF